MTPETRRLFNFISSSPDPYHTADTVCDFLVRHGYSEVLEYECATAPGDYFTRRGGSAVIAYRIPRCETRGFMITASHGDSPSLRLKPDPAKAAGEYTVIRSERYGGMLHGSWLDRPLELSGRASVRTTHGVAFKLFRSGDPAAVIPSVAIHLNRKANTDFTLDPARDLVPMWGDKFDVTALNQYIADLCGVAAEDVIAVDGVLSCMEPGFTFGNEEKFISAPRLDDLMCAFTMLEGFLTSSDSEAVPVFCLYDGEEIGSRMREGAACDFLPAVLKQIAGDDYSRMLQNTLLVSSDNAHAVHPNRPELSDNGAPVRLNGGVTVKHSASRSYTTEGSTDAIVTELCRKAGAPVQHFTNRSDLPGGSTLGAIALAGLPVLAVDIGAAQLAMHSAVETAGEQDVCHMINFAREFYSSALKVKSDRITILRGV